MIAFKYNLTKNKEDVWIAGVEIKGILIAIATFAKRTASDSASDHLINTV
ncbi:MAG: hypothetical protein KME40_14430 [Komarekiella atlantica HA4396-MV6]|jgi:hypothetical protein|nr:hypothetical protein [Komarekiella atlantica HA4396-MV6]